MNDTLQKILRYLLIMAAVFLAVCIIGIIKNWRVFSDVIGNTISVIVTFLVIIGLAFYFLFTSIFRR